MIGPEGATCRGKLANFTGIDSPYEVPEAPELHVDAGGGDAVGMAEQVVARLGLA